ncbi:hypothetical protein [Bradyrhizobium sp. RT10b]|uniref:hypothetical protein n=1 Tax=Bradyrhizobium sp. RT10b TaxID=3156331 RepID=UPI003397D936
MHHRIKIVPINEPNAEGEWRTITARDLQNMPPSRRGWLATADLLASFVPEGFTVVSVETCH